MKLSKSRRDSSIRFNMTPLIDIVFLLIIFFMTVSQITRTVDYPIELAPVDEGAILAEPAMVTLNLDKTGQIFVGGRKMSADSALNAIKNELENQDNDPGRIKIQLRCDRRCPAGHVNRLITKLSQMGFTRIDTAVSGR
ncbi:MAG: biopolymer transporter ExbD [Planctomycetota bacterium]